ncbi:MAG: tripartite tricarboxylate transporter TctB family protein [Desulfovibrio sp.]|nr:tripartite tricarboxylate transporter TctB family protein [Mailhella sp.]MBQ3893009.1 tripartite tricarboxylate transporter TctB family protein [Mailhella sp.]
MKRSDIGVVAVIYAICLLFFVMTLNLPEQAQTYPLCLLAGLFFLNTVYIGRAVLAYRRDKAMVDDVSESFGTFQAGQFFGTVALGVLYMVLLWLAGFYISTVLYMLAAMLFLRVPRLHIAVTAGAMLGIIYAVFTLFLKVPLPVGLLFK